MWKRRICNYYKWFWKLLCIEYSYCDKYNTYCKKLESLENEEIIYPKETHFFDNLAKSCNEYE